MMSAALRILIAALLAAAAPISSTFANPLATQSRAAEAPRIADVSLLRDLSKRWSAALKTFDAPGFALAVVKDSSVLAVDAFGVRNVAGEPATPDTCYYIASVTKPYMAMVVCTLVGDGKLDLDMPVEEYLPRLELPDEELSRTLTLRDLLCHRPGLACGTIAQHEIYTGRITDEIFFESMRECEIAHTVRYNNLHFTLAARVLEAVSGKKWQEVVTQRLFVPAGLKRTTTSASEMYGKGEHAEPMFLAGDQWLRSPLVKTDRTMHAAGGIGTTARDAARWLLLNLNRGELDGRRILTAKLADEYYAQQSAHAPEGRIRIEEGFALGWQVGKYRDPSRPFFFHGGGFPGASAYFCFLPNERIGVAVLSNSGEGGSDLAAIVSIDVLDRLLGVTDQPDLMPAYLEAAQRRRAQAVKPFPGGANPAKAEDGLSRPPGEYAGKYSHPQEGELEVRFEKGELSAHLGDLPYALVSTGLDEFTAIVVPGMAKSGSFEVEADGEVVAVSLASAGPARRFDRIGAKTRRVEPKSPPKFTAALYVGKYEGSGYKFVVREQDGKLLGHMTGPPPSPPQPELELHPSATEHKFEVPGEGAKLVFKVTGDRATGFTIHQGGDSVDFQRVER